MLYIEVAVYNLFLKLYELAITLLVSRNDRAAKWYAGRKDIFIKIQEALDKQPPKADRIWMHCASLGEFEQGRQLLEALRKEKPDAQIILTFFSPSGYEIRKNYTHADFVFYLPMDGKSNARRFLYLIRPTLVIFVKYEFWYHYFNETDKLNIPFILISAIFRKNQVFFKWYGGMYRKMLRCLTHIFVQDDASARLLNKHGFTHVSQIDDTRIDRVAHIAEQALTLPTLEMFLHGKKALVAGSIYDMENEMLAQAWKDNLINSKIILVPHQVDDAHIDKIKALWGDDYARYSIFHQPADKDKSVLIVDTIGLLSSMYKYADMALIGGGFGKGIHNILEPAAFGIPVIFGPKYHKFREAKDMIAEGSVFTFHDQETLKAALALMADTKRREEAGQKAGSYIQQHSGGTEKIMAWLKSSSVI